MHNKIGQTIAMLGASGSGMRGLATILEARGAHILRVDRESTEGVVDEIAAIHEISRMNLVIHTDALHYDHPLLVEARKMNVPIKIYHEALADITHHVRTIAVTGTHGKSSTTSMLAHIFISVGRDPLALVGASIPAWNNTNARIGRGDHFIVEADEYRNHFLSLDVESAIITSIDFDHPDFFASLDEVKNSFSQFLAHVSLRGAVVVPVALMKEFPDLKWPAQTIPVQPPKISIALILPGRHMQYNAWLAIQMAMFYGVSESDARQALAHFNGLSRRFELIGRKLTMDIISDYGHHPKEIIATLKATRERYPEGKILTIFEAHTKERLIQFLPAFCEALVLADGIILAPVFVPSGRDAVESDATSALEQLTEYLNKSGKSVYRAMHLSDIGPVLNELASEFRVCIAFSAGRVDKTLRSIVNFN